MQRKKIAVYCGSRVGHNPDFAQMAGDFGKALAQKGFDLVYGGGQVGLMGLVAEAVMKNGGQVIGVIPEGLFGKEIAAQNITELKVVASMHERKALMEKLSDAFVALPGGWGTLDELFEILTWKQIGLHHKPIAILNWNGFFDAMLTQMDQMMESGFVDRKNKDLFFVGLEIETVLGLLQASGIGRL